MPEGVVNRYSGFRLGDRFVVAATDQESEDEDRALVYDARSLAIAGDAPAPRGMWCGRLGDDRLVAIASAGRGRHKLFVSRVTI
jgi:hypothetical protein